MSDSVDIRDGEPGDWPALSALYPAAFPDEDLLPVLAELLRPGHDILSLVALRAGAPVGHILFTRARIAGRSERLDLLAPLAVAPDVQRRGIGSALVRAGFARLARAGSAQVEVLGDPAYYGRLGFLREDLVLPPYPLPEQWRAAWQVARLRETVPPMRGALLLPTPWLRPSLWMP